LKPGAPKSNTCVASRAFAGLLACAAVFRAAPGSPAADEGLGRVIYVRSQGAGVLIHAERGDVRLDFLSARIVRIADAKAPPSIPLLAAPIPRQPPQIKPLDPRFQAIETEALRVEIQRDPLRIRILDRGGTLLLEDDPDGGLGPFGPALWQWRARFAPQGGALGFGRLGPIVPGPGGSIDFAAPAQALAGQSPLLLPAAPCGRLGNGCGLAFSVAGQARLEFPQLGRMRFSNGGALEAFVFPAPDIESYWACLRAIVGLPAFPPRWLFGVGFMLDPCRSYREMLDLPGRLQSDKFPMDWTVFPAARPGAAGWNDPPGAMKPDAHLWQGAEERFKRMRNEGVAVVVEAPAACHAQAPVPSDFALDYDSPLADWESRFGPLRQAGMALWLLGEDSGRSSDSLQGAAPAAQGAERPRLRAARWRQWIEAKPDPARRAFVLDRRATPDMERLGCFLAPWAVQPMACQPSDAFRAAADAAESGWAFWGLELPVSPSAYPSPAAFRRWLQAAIAAPLLLLRANSWDEALPSRLPPEITREMDRLWTVRARLRPLIYSLAREASLSGIPLCRPAPGAASSGAQGALGRGAALRIGPDLLFLAADAEDGGAVSVDLPDGEWISLRDERRVQGGRRLDLRLEESQVEAFARRGSCIPFWGKADGAAAPMLVARIYPSASGAYRLYEDAGEGRGVESGEFAVTQIEWERQGAENALAIRVSGPLGDYSERSAARDLMLQIESGRLPLAVAVDGQMTTRLPFVAGPSRLLEAGPALQFKSALLPPRPLWDHDGTGLLYVWLPQRGSQSEVKIYAGPSLLPSEAPAL